MKSLVKNIIVLSILLIVCMPMLIGFLSYKIQIKAIKKELKQQFILKTPKEDLVHLKFDMNTAAYKKLKWKHSHEFVFNKKMFDIVSADTLGNTVYYICFPDKQETELNAKFNALLSARFAQEKPLNNKIYLYNNFIQSLIIEKIKPYTFYRNFRLEWSWSNAQHRLLSRIEKVPTPPPMFIFV